MSDLLRSARDVSLGTLASRALGLARDVVCTAFFPVYFLDAFYLAFTIPNLLRRLLGEGAMASAFIPVFASVREEEGDRAAADFFKATFTLLSVVLIGTFIVLRLCSGAAGMWLTHQKMRLFLHLLDVMLPLLIFVCLSALFAAALNSIGSFTLPAVGPAIVNLFWIGGVLLLGRTVGIGAAAGGVLAGGIVQCILLSAGSARAGMPAGFLWRPSHPGIKKLLILAGPVALGLSLIQANVFVDRIIAEVMVPGDGAVTALFLGNRMIQLPLGIFGIAMATAVFPKLSALAASGDREGMKNSLRQALRIVFFVAVPSAIGLAALRIQIVSLLFEHGSFTSEMTARTGNVILFYAAGLWACCGIHVVTRLLYSLQDVKTPVRTAMAMVAVNFILNLLLVGRFREGGLALATAITSTLTFVVLLAVCVRRIGTIGLGELFTSFGKTCFASAMMGIAISKFTAVAPEYFDTASLQGKILGLAIYVCGGAAVFFICAALIRTRELAEMRDAFLSPREEKHERE